MVTPPRPVPPPAPATPPEDTLARLMAASRRSFEAGDQAEQAFIERGLRAEAQARRSGRYVSARAVLHQLARQLADCGKP